jgi:folate-dependent phosphoribosylglycinamide formyltransferase PurN
MSKTLSGVILLTSGNVHAVRILEGLKKRGLFVDAIVYERSLKLSDYTRQRSPVVARSRALLRGLVRWGISPLARIKAKKVYSRYCSRVLLVGSINSAESIQELGRLKPSWILLGGVGILKPPILATAESGVLNSHPGLLPWARGTGVVGRSLERGYPVGVTCHYVSSGVDTGPIIEQRLLRVTGQEQSLKELEDANDLLAAEVMIDVVERFLAQHRIPEAIAQDRQCPICKWLSLSERQTADRKIQDGLALELFQRWQRVCSNDGTLRLQSQCVDGGGSQ